MMPYYKVLLRDRNGKLFGLLYGSPNKGASYSMKRRYKFPGVTRRSPGSGKYGLLIFGSLEHAERCAQAFGHAAHLDTVIFEVRPGCRIWEPDYTGAKMLTLEGGNKLVESWFAWPIGTLMTTSVRLIMEVQQ